MDFQHMQKELVNTVQYLKREQLTPFLYGSFTICLYANQPLIQAQDIDLAFSSRAEHDRAVQSLEETHQFSRIKQITWESESGEESINTKLRSPGGTEFDLSYTKGDIELTLDPNQTIILDNTAIPALSLEDLLRSYQRFSNEKPGAEVKIKLLNELIAVRCRNGSDFPIPCV